jgi:hypothetical protein
VNCENCRTIIDPFFIFLFYTKNNKTGQGGIKMNTIVENQVFTYYKEGVLEYIYLGGNKEINIQFPHEAAENNYNQYQRYSTSETAQWTEESGYMNSGAGQMAYMAGSAYETVEAFYWDTA